MTRVFLVYGRYPVSGDEPLIAVLDDEDDAVRLERRLTPNRPMDRVSWEEFPLRDDGTGTRATTGTIVHIVTQGGPDGDQWSSTVDPATTIDPIGLAVFQDVEDARRFAADQDDRRTVVRSLPIGWHDPAHTAPDAGEE